MTTIRRTHGTSQIPNLPTRLGDIDSLSGPPTNDSHETDERNIDITQAETIARCNPAAKKQTDALSALKATYSSMSASEKSNRADVYEISNNTSANVFVSNSFPIKDGTGNVLSNQIEIDCTNITHLCFEDVSKDDETFQIELINCEKLQWVFLPGNTNQNCLFLKAKGKIVDLVVMGQMKEFACAWDTEINGKVNENYNFVFEKCAESIHTDGSIVLHDVEYRNAYIGTDIGIDGDTLYADIFVIDKSNPSSTLQQVASSNEETEVQETKKPKRSTKKATTTASSRYYIADDEDDYEDDYEEASRSQHTYLRRNAAVRKPENMYFVDSDLMVFHAQSVYLDGFNALKLLVVTGRVKNVETKNCSELFAIVNNFHYNRLKKEIVAASQKNADTSKSDCEKMIASLLTDYESQLKAVAKKDAPGVETSSTKSTMRLRNNPKSGSSATELPSRYAAPTYTSAIEGFEKGARASRSQIKNTTMAKISPDIDVEGVFVQTCSKFQMLLVNSNFVCFTNITGRKNIILDVAERICLDDCALKILVLNECKTLYILDADLLIKSQGMPIQQLDFPNQVSDADGFAIWVADEKSFRLPLIMGKGMITEQGAVVPKIVEIQPSIGLSQTQFELDLASLFEDAKRDAIVRKGLEDWSFRQTYPIKTAIAINTMASTPIAQSAYYKAINPDADGLALLKAYRKSAWVNLLYKFSCMNGAAALDKDTYKQLVQMHDETSNDFHKRPFDFVLKFQQISKDVQDSDSKRLRALYISAWENSIKIYRLAATTSLTDGGFDPRRDWGDEYLSKSFAPIQLRTMMCFIAEAASLIAHKHNDVNVLSIQSNDIANYPTGDQVYIQLAQDFVGYINGSLRTFVEKIAYKMPILQEYDSTGKIIKLEPQTNTSLNQTQFDDDNVNASLNVMYKYMNAFSVDSSNFAHDFNMECLVEILDVFMNGIPLTIGNTKVPAKPLLEVYSIQDAAAFLAHFDNYTNVYPYNEKLSIVCETLQKYGLSAKILTPVTYLSEHQVNKKLAAGIYSDALKKLEAAGRVPRLIQKQELEDKLDQIYRLISKKQFNSRR